MTLGRLAIASLIASVSLAAMWVGSYRAVGRATFKISSGRYTIRSEQGEITLLAPLLDGPRDAEFMRLAAAMSNDDFTFSAYGERYGDYFIEGDLRKQSATWKMYDYERAHRLYSARTVLPPRAWLKALDDPNRYVSAHLLLSLMMDRWRDAKLDDDGMPIVFVPGDKVTLRPDLSQQKQIRDRWVDRLSVPVIQIPYLIFVGATLVAPVAWLVRPRGQRRRFVYGEQGFGDAILFSRYVPLLARRGARIVLEARPELLELFKTLEGVHQLIPRGEPLPSFDVHASLVSLPFCLGTTPVTVPAEVPYLKADVDRVERWREKISLLSLDGLLRVGLVWAGSRTALHNELRSLPLRDFAPLGQVQGIRWFSLQVGPDAQQLNEAPEGMDLVNLGSGFDDFADTAAAIANLDLVIGVDTSTIHVAGAIGKPVWLLEPYVPYWPWLIEPQTTPWYPTLRLFRQPSRGDWNAVIKQIVSALRELLNNPPRFTNTSC